MRYCHAKNDAADAWIMIAAFYFQILIVIFYIVAFFVYNPPPVSSLDSLDERNFMGTMAQENVGLPTAHAAGGGLSELVREKLNSYSSPTVSYKALQEDLDSDFGWATACPASL